MFSSYWCSHEDYMCPALDLEGRMFEAGIVAGTFESRVYPS